MSDSPDPGTPPPPTPARPQPARPAEPGHPAPTARRRPTPAREAWGSSGHEVEQPEPDASDVSFRVADEEWVACVSGRSQGGASQSPVPMLLVRFEREDGSAPPREALVVGRRLSDLSPAQLETALHAARPPWSGEPREIFPEAQERRRRRG